MSTVDTAQSKNGTRWLASSAFWPVIASSVSLVSVILLIALCPACSSASLPSGALILALVATCCLVFSTIAGATRKHSKWEQVSQLIVALVLCVFPLIAIYIAMSGQAFCPLCLLFWIGILSTAFILGANSKVLRILVSSVLLGSAVIVIGLRAPLPDVSARRIIAGQFLNRIWEEPIKQQAPKIKVGQLLTELPPNTSTCVFYSTKCAPCILLHSVESLKKKGIVTRGLLVVQPNAATDWLVPSGYKGAKRIVSKRAWDEAMTSGDGPPLLVIVKDSKVMEILL